VINRYQYPVSLAIVGDKLSVFTPDQLRLRQEFLIDANLSVEAVRCGFVIHGPRLAELRIISSGKTADIIFRNLSESEIQWAVHTVNSFLKSRVEATRNGRGS